MRDRSELSLIGVVGLLATGAGLWVVAGPYGVGGGAALAILWLFVPPVYVVALAHVGLAAASPESIPVVALAAVEVGAIGVLTGRRATPRHLFVVMLAIAGLIAILWLLRGTGQDLWVVGMALVLTATIVAYGFHRYELVRLGLVRGEGL